MLASAFGALLVGALAFTLLGREFIPTLDEGDIAMQALRVPSASCAMPMRASRQAK